MDGKKIEGPCPHCGRVEDGHWYKPCPSDDCPSNAPLTKVLFRRWRAEGKEIVALFPLDPGTNDPTTCCSYMHVGQHGSADLWGMMRRTRPVKDPKEYAELKAELEGLGYRLKVARRSGYRDREAREREIAKVVGK